jgi:coproporphyrinogen III oxidase
MWTSLALAAIAVWGIVKLYQHLTQQDEAEHMTEQWRRENVYRRGKYGDLP